MPSHSPSPPSPERSTAASGLAAAAVGTRAPPPPGRSAGAARRGRVACPCQHQPRTRSPILGVVVGASGGAMGAVVAARVAATVAIAAYSRKPRQHPPSRPRFPPLWKTSDLQTHPPRPQALPRPSAPSPPRHGCALLGVRVWPATSAAHPYAPLLPGLTPGCPSTVAREATKHSGSITCTVSP